MNENKAKMFKSLREFFGLTKTELAKKLQVESKLITQIEESGTTDDDMLYRYAEVFGVSSYELNHLVIAIERCKVKNGNIIEGDKKNARRAVKDAHDLVKQVLEREILLATTTLKTATINGWK